MLTLSILCFSLLVSFTHAFPLVRRDVWAPKITNPNAETVWPVGTKQTVEWDTSNKPVNVTNPIGKVILGHMENDSLNLQLNDPLAQNFNLTDGKVQITVPNVPPRDDYLIVLMGDSGNTSPTFAIARISGGSPSASTSSTTDKPNTSTLISNAIPISGTMITGGQSSTSGSSTINTSSAPISTATTLATTPAITPSSALTTSRLSDSTSSSSAPATSTSTNSAAALSNMNSINGLLVCMAVTVLSLI